MHDYTVSFPACTTYALLSLLSLIALTMRQL